MERRGLRVYAVDDEASVLEWLKSSIDWEAYNCEIVGFSVSSREALEYIRKEPVDLLITDICLPDMSGIDMIKEVKELFSEIQIIVISAYDMFSYVKKAFQYGIIDYCLKPIDSVELMESIKAAVNAYEERWMYYFNQDRRNFRNNLLLQLLNDNVSEYKFEDQCKLVGIDLDESVWKVLVVNTKVLDMEKRVVILNDCIGKEQKDYYCFQDADMNFVFLFHGDAVSENSLRVLEYLRQETGDFDVTFYMGKDRHSCREVTESYKVCRDFLCAGFLFRESVVYEADYAYEKYLNVMKRKELQQIVNSLKVYDVEGILQMIRKILGRCQTEAEKRMEIISLTVFLVRSLQSLFTNYDIVTRGDLEELESPEKMLSWVQIFLEKNLKRKDEIENGLHPYVKFALQEISTRYADCTLSLQNVASARGISTSYMGRLFRTQVGCFFNDYLLKIRLKNASEQLCNNKKNIGEIASSVGFINQSYFNKMFRRNYGVSPAEYRRMSLE